MGHVANNILACCNCPDGENKYNHPCGCPIVETTFKSKQRTAVLCGFNEYSSEEVPPSIPPKRYLKKTWNIYEHWGPNTYSYISSTPWCYSGDDECILVSFPDEDPFEECEPVSVRNVSGGTYNARDAYVARDETWIAEAEANETGCVYPSTQWGSQNATNCNPGNSIDCAWQWQGDNADPTPPVKPYPGELDPPPAICEEHGYSYLNIGYNDPNEYYSNDECIFTDIGDTAIKVISNTVMGYDYITKVTCNRDPQIRAQRYGISSGFGNYATINFDEWDAVEINYKQTITLSVPDSDEDALSRATEVVGKSNSSIWELRTTEYDFVKRESSYTLKASNLKAGIQYRGCVVIERRRAFSGAVPEDTPEWELDWHDVEPDIIEPFTADPDENGETTIAEDVDLPHVEGWEYRVKVDNSGYYLVNIWPTYADCECPSEWEPEE